MSDLPPPTLPVNSLRPEVVQKAAFMLAMSCEVIAETMADQGTPIDSNELLSAIFTFLNFAVETYSKCVTDETRDAFQTAIIGGLTRIQQTVCPTVDATKVN